MNDEVWRRRIIATLLIGVLLRAVIGFGLLAEMPQTEDGPSYRQQALEMIDGSAGYFFFPPGTAVASIPFYVTFGRSLHVDHAVAISFWTLFTIACAALAWALCNDKKVAWIATTMAVFLPHGILATCTISSQPLTAAFVAGALTCAIHAYSSRSMFLWSISCILLSFAVVARPAAMLLTVASAGALLYLWRRRYVQSRQMLIAVCLLVVTHSIMLLPVMLHNNANGQGYTLSTNNEWNLLVGNNPYTPDYKTGHFGQRTFDKLEPEARAYLTDILPHQQPAYATYSERMAMKDSATSYVLHHPLRTIYRMTNRFRGFWGMDYTASRELQNVYHLSNHSTLVLLALEGGGFVFVLFLAIIGLYLRLDKRINLMAIIVITASIAPYLIAFAVAKYHTIVLPLLFPLSASALLLITSQSERKILTDNHRIALVFIAVTTALIQVEHVMHIVDNQ